jgi:hypothetical protein
MNPTYKHFLDKATDAMRGGIDAWACQSSGERAAVAFVLNRPDWLAIDGHSMVEALERMGQEWASLAPRVARALADECTGPALLNWSNWQAADLERVGQVAQRMREQAMRRD